MNIMTVVLVVRVEGGEELPATELRTMIDEMGLSIDGNIRVESMEADSFSLGALARMNKTPRVRPHENSPSYIKYTVPVVPKTMLQDSN